MGDTKARQESDEGGRRTLIIDQDFNLALLHYSYTPMQEFSPGWCRTQGRRICARTCSACGVQGWKIQLTSRWCPNPEARAPVSCSSPLRERDHKATRPLTMPMTVPSSSGASALASDTKPAEKSRANSPTMPRPRAQLLDRVFMVENVRLVEGKRQRQGK